MRATVGFLLGVATTATLAVYVVREIDRSRARAPTEITFRELPRLECPLVTHPDLEPVTVRPRPQQDDRPRQRPAATVTCVAEPIPVRDRARSEADAENAQEALSDEVDTGTWQPVRADRQPLALVIAAGGGIEVSPTRSFETISQWGLRLNVAPSDRLAFDVGFNRGSRGRISTTSIELMARLYPVSRRAMLRPYLAGGVGWRRFHAPVDTDVILFPAALGLTYSRGRWHADARLIVRPASKTRYHTVGAETFLGLSF